MAKGATGPTPKPEFRRVSSAVVIIPARMAAQRLPGKPLADIGGLPMIVRALRQAEAAAIGPVVVAAGDPEIVAAVEAHGGTAVLTDPDLKSDAERYVRGFARELQAFGPESTGVLARLASDGGRAFLLLDAAVGDLG